MNTSHTQKSEGGGRMERIGKAEEKKLLLCDDCVYDVYPVESCLIHSFPSFLLPFSFSFSFFSLVIKEPSKKRDPVIIKPFYTQQFTKETREERYGKKEEGEKKRNWKNVKKEPFLHKKRDGRMNRKMEGKNGEKRQLLVLSPSFI